jgi:hypothetical protein
MFSSVGAQSHPKSAIAVVEGEDWLDATACCPCSVAIWRMAFAVESRVPSQEIGTRPGSASTAPWQELSDDSAALVGCGHVSGLLMRRMCRWP